MRQNAAVHSGLQSTHSLIVFVAVSGLTTVPMVASRYVVLVVIALIIVGIIASIVVTSSSPPTLLKKACKYGP